MLQRNLDKNILREKIQHHQKVIFKSRFSFLRTHHGLRPGYSLLIGTAGSGKSSVAQAIGADCSHTEGVLFWLSEERSFNYEMGVRISTNTFISENITYLEERDIPVSVKSKREYLLTFFKEKVIESGAKAVILDNITTSAFYRLPFWEHEHIISEFVTFADENDIALLVISHTEKEISDNMNREMKGEDVRGTNQSYQQAEYAYCFQRFISETQSVQSKIYSIMILKKHRYHKGIEDKYFMLNFRNNFYTSDKAIPFGVLNDIFSRRNTLGKKAKQ